MAIALCSGCGSSDDGKPRGEDLTGSTGGQGNQWRLVHAESQSTTLYTLLEFEIQPLSFVNPSAAAAGFGGFYRQNIKDTAYRYDDQNELQHVDQFYFPPTYSLKQSASDERIKLSQEQFLNYSFTDETLELVRGEKKPFFERGERVSTTEFFNLSASEWSEAITQWQKVPQPLTQAGCDGEIFDAAATERILADPAPPSTTFDFAADITNFCISTQASTTTQNIFNWDELAPPEANAADAILPAPTDRVFDPQTGKLIKLTQYNSQPDTEPALITDLSYDNQGRLQATQLRFSTRLSITNSPDDIWFTIKNEAEIQYRYPEQGVVIAEIYEVDEGERGLIQTLTANYEPAPCGPLTQERDRHQVPSLFPMCL